MADHVEAGERRTRPTCSLGAAGRHRRGQDLDYHSRHLEMDYSILRWSDKPFIVYGTSGEKARDAFDLAAIVGRRARRSGRSADGARHRQPQQPACVGRPHGHHPRRLRRGRAARRDHAVPPRRRVGSVTLAGAGSRSFVAETLAGVAMAQAGASWHAVHPRRASTASTCAAAGPRSASRVGARHSPAPRSRARCRLRCAAAAGCSGIALDAQVATETTMSLWATYLAGCDLVVHSAGWLEGGLTASYEAALDLEILRMFERLRADRRRRRQPGVRRHRGARARRALPRPRAHP
jgi:trimethylamine--corrinoid protein Co-methyltransferase